MNCYSSGHRSAESHKLAALNKESKQLDIIGSLPSPFDPLPSWVGIRENLVQQKGNCSECDVRSRGPQKLIYPWSSASISADAVYYTLDLGRSWKQLKVPGYLGVLGVNSNSDELYWSTGNWYDAKDLDIKKNYFKLIFLRTLKIGCRFYGTKTELSLLCLF